MNSDITYQIYPPAVTTDTLNSFNLYITNFSKNEPFEFCNKNKIPAKDLPRIGDVPTPDKNYDVTWFYVYFDYGENATALVSKNNIDTISFNPPPGWDVDHDHDDDIEIYWILCPKEDVRLEPGSNILFNLSGIMCNKTPGNYAIYIQPVINNERQPVIRYSEGLIKVPKPAITMFKAEKDDYELGDKVRLLWSLEHAEKSTVKLDNKPIQDKCEAIVDIEDRDYVLQVKNELGCKVEKVFRPKFLRIKYFEYDALKRPGHLVLKWETENAESCTLNSTNVGLTGEYEAEIEARYSSFTLYATKGNLRYFKYLTYEYSPVVKKCFTLLYNKATDLVHVKWELESAEQCKLEYRNHVENVEPRGECDLKLDDGTDLKLSAYAAGTTVKWSHSLHFVKAKVDLKIKTENNVYNSQYDEATLSWESINAISCHIDGKEVELRGKKTGAFSEHGKTVKVTVTATGSDGTQVSRQAEFTNI